MTFNCFEYQLPFVTPLTTSNRTYAKRNGIILVYRTEQFEWYGEAAPLPGFSSEDIAEVKEKLITHKDHINNILSAGKPIQLLSKLYKRELIPASLQFGLDSLAYQIEAQNNNQRLVEHIFSEYEEKIPVNALISLTDSSILSRIQENKENGYTTFKGKIGIDFDRELKLIKKIRSHFPDITIRLDANQAWSLDQAISFCNDLAPLNIEYCEEPLTDNTPENCETLSQNIPIPIALDESTTQHSYWPNLLPYTDYLILKPMVTGSFQKNFETKRLANTHNNKVVVTTSLEGSVGRYFSGILAAGIGSSQIAHGLSTRHLLKDDVLQDDSFVSNGYLAIMDCKLGTIDFNRQQIFTNVF
ncbi:o-succinylbenzoate synthase [Fodinibius sp. Rm-B-1B1-1]|uniref:o-succinylbenzoate synthase n=1 Tax=Fodinibius alkaliphilus TaxID=3140241 RepID=UPI00315B05ED